MVRLIQRLLPRREPLDPGRLKRAKPIRNPAVELERREDGMVLLVAPVAETTWGLKRRWAKASKKPLLKRFELEPVGAFVWDLCDGQRTVEGIGRALREEFKLNRVEADAALRAFLQTLAQRRLVTLLIPDQTDGKKPRQSQRR